MKLLVFSDSHGKTEPMCRMIEREKPDLVVHLGDYVRDAEALRAQFPQLPLKNVCGNCDRDLGAPVREEFSFDGVQIFACHGHRYNVKYGLDPLKNALWFSGARLALFGHTHRAMCEDFDGLTLLNPGTARTTCALVETDGAGGFTAALLDME